MNKGEFCKISVSCTDNCRAKSRSNFLAGRCSGSEMVIAESFKYLHVLTLPAYQDSDARLDNGNGILENAFTIKN